MQDRVQASRKQYGLQRKRWREAEREAVAYLPETERDFHAQTKRRTGQPEYKTLKLPYSYGMLLASHTYWTTVFMSRSPINQFTGRHGESQQQIQALEALIDYQVRVGDQMVPLYLWLYDAGKYGLGVVHNGWVEEQSVVASIEETPELFAGVIPTGRTKKRKISRTVRGYAGNRLTNIRPYDFFPDPRVPVRFFQKGEFCAARHELGLNTVMKRAEQGYYIEEALKHVRQREVSHGATVDDAYREYGSEVVQLPLDDSFFVYDKHNRDGSSINNILVKLVECTIELIPKDWGLGSGTYPEKWVFSTTADFNVLLGAQPLGRNHDKFEYAVLEYEPEGYGLTSRGIPEITQPIGETLDWLVNSHLYNVRKTLNDQFIVDPSRIVAGDLNNPLPGGIIRMKPQAYGEDVRTAITQLSQHDVTRTHLNDMSALQAFGQRAFGISDQIQGAIPPTGRRSATEVRTGAGFGINRLKTTSEFFSFMGWAPLVQMQVQNSQQYYDEEKKFRIVGDLLQGAGQGFIDVTPEDILGFYDYVPIDGTMPIDRLAQSQLWTQLFGQISRFPQVVQQYDMGRIFEWVGQLAGLKNMSRFKIELQPDALLAQQAQQGNVVPLPTQTTRGNPAPEQPPQQTLQGGPGGLP